MDKGLVSNYAEQIRGVSYKPNDLHDGLDKDSVVLLRANNIDDGKINFDDVVKVRGMDIVLVTTAKTNEEAYELLKELGIPFRK